MRSALRFWMALMALLCSSVLCAAATHILTVSPSSVNFGSQPVNTTTTQSIVITNSGTGFVQVQAVNISGSTVFKVSGFSSTVALRPGQYLTLSVSFTPTAATSYSGALAITASGGASKSVPLSGAGTGTTQVAITISPTMAAVQAGNSQQFTASVTGTTNTAVNWLVNNMLGGNSAVGFISSTGLYTAPSAIPSGGTVTVTAQSQADTTKSANATVTITAGSTTIYSNIDDSTILNANGSTIGWGWCDTSSCAGGSGNATQSMSWGQQPSLDGGSTQFMISGNAYADGLWWYKIGANDSVSNFKFDFWLNLSQAATSYSQALEFDVFQYISPTRYMFGTQCDYASGYQSGVWDVWNANAHAWYKTGFPCPAFVAGDWYHITWNFDRTSDLYEHYNSVTVQHYDSTGTKQLDSSSTNINLAFLSNALPSGWSDNMGVNFQLDINGTPGSSGTATYTTLVDEVTLTVW
jgi:hypothetical protein